MILGLDSTNIVILVRVILISSGAFPSDDGKKKTENYQEAIEGIRFMEVMKRKNKENSTNFIKISASYCKKEAIRQGNNILTD